jgi:DNA-binding SARP family transcriptional activator
VTESHLRIYLFRDFQVWRGGEVVPAAAWRTRKHAALLKILVGERGRAVPSDRLVEWLWPDLFPKAGLANLHVGISLLRRVLEPGLATPAASSYILTRRPGYLFDPSPGCWIDVDAFTAGLAEAQGHLRAGRAARAIQSYETAVGLYRGDYLADDPYEDWAIGPRERLREQYLEALGQLGRLNLAAGDANAALKWAQDVLEIDACREEAHRQVMRALYALGRQADALRQFERCREILREELGVEAMPRTLLLHQQVLAGRVQVVGEATGAEPALGQIPFVGRETELRALRGVLDRVRRQGCQVALISGEAGVGKTHLIEEFAAGVSEQGGVLLQARCHALERDLPYQPLRETLSEAVAVTEIPALTDGLGPWFGVIAAVLPALRERCPDLEPPPPLPPAEERARLLYGLTRLVRFLAREGPLLLFVDDLQWADGATLQALHYLSAHLGDCPVLLLGAYRAEEVETVGQPGVTTLGELLAGLRRDGRAIELSLPRLSQEEVTALIAVMSRSPYGGRLFSQRLYQGTEGNPLFLAETLRALFEQGVLYHDERGAWATDIDEVTEAYEELPIPATVREVVQSRCGQLPETQQRDLAAAAVIGRPFEFGLWRHTTGTSEAELVEILEQCLLRRLLQQREDGRYDFGHGVIREVLYQALLPERRQLQHRRVAEVLAGDDRAPAGEIAWHYAMAGERRKALQYWMLAGTTGRQLFALQEAHGHFRRALTAIEEEGIGLDDDRAGLEQRYDVVRNLALLSSLLGKREDERRHLEEGLALAQTLGDDDKHCEVGLALAKYHFLTGGLEQALEKARQIARFCRETGNLDWEVNALRLAGFYEYRLGQKDEAFETMERALQLSRRVADRQAEAQCSNALAVMRYFEGDYSRALMGWQQARTICQEIGLRPVEAQVAANIGVVYRVLGRCAEAKSHLEQGLTMAREVGFRTVQPDALLNLGLCCSTLGEPEEGLRLVEEGLALAREVHYTELAIRCLNGLALIHLGLDEPAHAQQALTRAGESLEMAQKAGLRQGTALAQSLQGRAHLSMGRLTEAEKSSARAVQLLEQGAEAAFEEQIYAHHAWILQAAGKADQAQSYLEKARAELLAKAERITDPDLRQCFLEEVAVNREILV